VARLETEGSGTAWPEEGDERRRAAVGYAQHGGAAGGARCRWKPEVGADGETKVGRVTKWAESQGGCSINSFFKIKLSDFETFE
jgi:hypothetical protein